jgi:hypothetical protein
MLYYLFKIQQMNKFNLIIVFLVMVFFLISCNQNSRTADNTKVASSESFSSKDAIFERFQANFEQIAHDNLNELGLKFNNYYLAKDNNLVEVSQIYKESFLKNLNHEYIYYGFKTELPNKSIILTFLKHYGAENVTLGEVIDTTFFVSHVYNSSGEFQSSFRSFGSNLAGEPPTYNMISTFDYDGDRLIITNKEYSTGKSYSEAKPLPGSDSIYLADLTTTKYYLDYSTNKVVLINKLKSKAKVVESYRNPLPVIFKPID